MHSVITRGQHRLADVYDRVTGALAVRLLTRVIETLRGQADRLRVLTAAIHDLRTSLHHRFDRLENIVTEQTSELDASVAALSEQVTRVADGITAPVAELQQKLADALAQRDLSVEQARTLIEDAQENVGRIREQTDRLAAIGSQPEPTPEPAPAEPTEDEPTPAPGEESPAVSDETPVEPSGDERL
jgi:methyl-accepting chemotaxis protein